MRIFIIILLFMGLMGSYAEAKPKEIVAEYLGCEAVMGYEEHAFMSKNNIVYMITFCGGVNPEMCNEFCNSCSSYAERPELEKRQNEFDIIRNLRSDEYIGHQFVINAEKTQKENADWGKYTKVLASTIKLDTNKNAPSYTKISPLKTIIGKLRHYEDEKNVRSVVTTSKGKKCEIILERSARSYDYTNINNVPENKYFIFKGHFLFYDKPIVFSVTESPKPYEP